MFVYDKEGIYKLDSYFGSLDEHKDAIKHLSLFSFEWKNDGNLRLGLASAKTNFFSY